MNPGGDSRGLVELQEHRTGVDMLQESMSPTEPGRFSLGVGRAPADPRVLVLMRDNESAPASSSSIGCRSRPQITTTETSRGEQ